MDAYFDRSRDIEFDDSFDFFVKKCSFICILLKKQPNSVLW